jgi:hypothetical protein
MIVTDRRFEGCIVEVEVLLEFGVICPHRGLTVIFG